MLMNREVLIILKFDDIFAVLFNFPFIEFIYKKMENFIITVIKVNFKGELSFLSVIQLLHKFCYK